MQAGLWKRSMFAASRRRKAVSPIISAQMRRWLIVLFLILLPYQSVWASAAQYCVHEEDAGATHFGHHGHKHHSARADKAGAAGIFDADCSTCHMTSAAPVPSENFELMLVHLREPLSYADPPYLSRVPAGPERPDKVTPRPAVRFGGGVLAAIPS